MQNWEQYQRAYQAADAATKSKLHSSLIPECVGKTVVNQKLDQAHHKTLVQLFAEKTVGITDDEKMKLAMRTAGIPNADQVLQEITACMTTHTASVADTSLEQPTNTPETAPAEPNTSDLDQAIKEAEAALESIPKIKTMAQDAEEATHSSSQDSILRRPS